MLCHVQSETYGVMTPILMDGEKKLRVQEQKLYHNIRVILKENDAKNSAENPEKTETKLEQEKENHGIVDSDGDDEEIPQGVKDFVGAQEYVAEPTEEELSEESRRPVHQRITHK